jgi:hypothetical protein
VERGCERLENPVVFREVLAEDQNWQSMEIEVGVMNEGEKQILSDYTRQRRAEESGVISWNHDEKQNLMDYVQKALEREGDGAAVGQTVRI